MKKAVVTGGCGFIGSHITDRLLKEGYTVWVIDNLSTGRLLNLDHQKNNPHLKICIADINNTDKTEACYQDCEVLFHIAALADIVPSIERPTEYHKANVDGTISVLEQCRKYGVKRIVYAASSSCYGIPDNFPTPENAPIRCQYPYAVTKYIGEEYCMYWHKVYNMNITSMRFFNVYGTRSRTSGTYGAVFGVFLAQKINNRPYTVVGDGRQTRDFTYVTDVADACFSASLREDIAGEIFNVGSGSHYSVNLLCDLLGGEKIYIPKRPGEPDCTFADTSKIKEKLNWKPKVDFETGVKMMIDNIDYWREAPVWNPENIAEATKDWFKYLGK